MTSQTSGGRRPHDHRRSTRLRDFHTDNLAVLVGNGDGRGDYPGGRAVLGRQAGLSGGFYVEPTIDTGVDNSARIAREEIFGPVLVVIPFDTDEEAVPIANDYDFGLVAGVWTRDISRALTVSDRIRAGQVFVNWHEVGGRFVVVDQHDVRGIPR